MSEPTTAVIMELLVAALPYPAQMTDIELGTAAVEFTWRGHRFHVDASRYPVHVSEVEGGLTSGSAAVLLLEALLGRAWLARDERLAKKAGAQ
jgi:hypothetical protein